MDLWLYQCCISYPSSLTLEEEGVEFEDERRCADIRVNLWSGCSCLRVGMCGDIDGGANGGPLDFRCENTDTGATPSCRPHCSVSV